ncbi:hypothetical protein HBP99_12150 [Listeria booriae]|uniref:protein-export chaperone SecB n=1 Tax=Listeria booriae TaxID=1552123 RepID=UPI00162662CC|nr:protein-export chaperone SecB [Listeria booriae]MBC2369390.1 hypothetical protein [Listeria booriae]
MPVITFEDYTVDNMSYKRNPKFDYKTEEMEIGASFDVEIKISDDDTAAILIFDIGVGGLESERSPFLAKAKVNGFFKYKPDNDEEGVGFQKHMEVNSIAILFPYVRSIIADLTSRSNEFPTCILPTMNVVKTLEESGSIRIVREHN